MHVENDSRLIRLNIEYMYFMHKSDFELTILPATPINIFSFFLLFSFFFSFMYTIVSPHTFYIIIMHTLNKNLTKCINKSVHIKILSLEFRCRLSVIVTVVFVVIVIVVVFVLFVQSTLISIDANFFPKYIDFFFPFSSSIFAQCEKFENSLKIEIHQPLFDQI